MVSPIQYDPQLFRLKQDGSWVQLYETEADADVAFIVGDRKFNAHKSVLGVAAKPLFDMVMAEGLWKDESGSSNNRNRNSSQDIENNSHDSSNSSANTNSRCDKVLELENITEAEFAAILQAIYLAKEPSLTTKDEALSLLTAADKFGCSDLKLHIEYVIVEQYLTPSLKRKRKCKPLTETFSGRHHPRQPPANHPLSSSRSSSAVELLVFAHYHSCALLKEAAMEACVLHPAIVSSSFSKLNDEPQLFEDLWKYSHVDRAKRIPSSHAVVSLDRLEQYSLSIRKTCIDMFDVPSLLAISKEANLSIDGSRIILVDRLVEYFQCRDESKRQAGAIGRKRSFKG
eukprot:jgi/Psemu1/30506/gm1.30506_g